MTLSVSLAVADASARRTKRFEAIIDSGATRCLFHADLADALGLKLKDGVRETTNGIGGPQETWLHDVTLMIPGGPVTTRAGFKETLPVAGLLGMKGFFEHFIVTFDTTLKECDLERIRPT